MGRGAKWANSPKTSTHEHISSIQAQQIPMSPLSSAWLSSCIFDARRSYAAGALTAGVVGTLPLTITLPFKSSFLIFNAAWPSRRSSPKSSMLGILVISRTNDVPQKAAEYFVTYYKRQNEQISEMKVTHVVCARTLNSFLWLSARVSGLMVTASKIASATCCESHGLTTMEPFKLCAAPANSDRIMTPCRSCWHAIYSYDTCFQFYKY